MPHIVDDPGYTSVFLMLSFTDFVCFLNDHRPMVQPLTDIEFTILDRQKHVDAFCKGHANEY